MNIMTYLDKMSTIKRWSQSHCTKSESVLEHTGFVAMYSIHMCYKYGIDPGPVLEKAILHDMEEVITGDIPTTTKYASDSISMSIKEIESDAALLISESLFFDNAFDIWNASKDVDTESGAIVSIADAAAVVHKILQEVSIGNRRFLEFKGNILKSLSMKLGISDEKFDSDINNLINLIGDLK